MLRKVISVILMFLVMNLAVSAFGSDNDEKDAKYAAKMRSEVAKTGPGTDTKVAVKLKDGTKLNGYIKEANNEEFVIVDSQNNAKSIPYPAVRRISKRTIGWIVIAGLVVVLVAYAASVKD